MLFYGPPGTGKTSTILALAKSLFGPSLYRSRILELNASDERGIGIVREKIKDFARIQLSQPPAIDSAYRSQYPCPPFKIIILDEADSMTQDAQAALRRTMERYSRITRFCLVCNYVTRIIDPLASRCSKFRFKALDGTAAAARLEQIAKLEKLKLDDGVIDTLIRCSEGDLRRAITFLQSAARLVGSNIMAGSDKDENSDDEMIDADRAGVITTRIIEEIAGVVPDKIMDRLIQAMQPKKGRTSYKEVSQVVTDIVADGWSATQILTQVGLNARPHGSESPQLTNSRCTN
jgi:replication factor C subunit 2/4